jgi:hypothetical protein
LSNPALRLEHRNDAGAVERRLSVGEGQRLDQQADITADDVVAVLRRAEIGLIGVVQIGRDLLAGCTARLQAQIAFHGDPSRGHYDPRNRRGGIGKGLRAECFCAGNANNQQGQGQYRK